MHITEFKKVLDIDDEIGSLHSKLAELYAARALFVNNPSAALVTSNQKKPGSQKVSSVHASSPNQLYSDLMTAWAVHGITIPAYTKLKQQLAKACGVIQQLTTHDSVVGSRMSVLLVPPTTVLTFPVNSSIRQSQPHVILNDFVNPDVLRLAHYKKNTWQVLVAYTGENGLDYGSAALIIKNKSYKLVGFDSRALGPQQYAALTMQLNRPLDQGTWNVLLNDTNMLKNNLVTSVTFLKGQFRFELDEANSALGEERFRPAIEIKAT